MALTIETAEADELARFLARLAGESMTEDVIKTSRERLERKRIRRNAAVELPARLKALSGRVLAHYDMSPVGRAEWDLAAGDEG